MKTRKIKIEKKKRVFVQVWIICDFCLLSDVFVIYNYSFLSDLLFISSCFSFKNVEWVQILSPVTLIRILSRQKFKKVLIFLVLELWSSKLPHKTSISSSWLIQFENMTLPYQSTSRNVQSVPDFDKPSVIIVDGANIAIASEFINVNDKKTEKDRRIYSITKLSPNTRK